MGPAEYYRQALEDVVAHLKRLGDISAISPAHHPCAEVFRAAARITESTLAFGRLLEDFERTHAAATSLAKALRDHGQLLGCLGERRPESLEAHEERGHGRVDVEEPVQAAHNLHDGDANLEPDLDDSVDPRGDRPGHG